MYAVKYGIGFNAALNGGALDDAPGFDGLVVNLDGFGLCFGLIRLAVVTLVAVAQPGAQGEDDGGEADADENGLDHLRLTPCVVMMRRTVLPTVSTSRPQP